MIEIYDIIKWLEKELEEITGSFEVELHREDMIIVCSGEIIKNFQVFGDGSEEPIYTEQDCQILDIHELFIQFGDFESDIRNEYIEQIKEHFKI